MSWLPFAAVSLRARLVLLVLVVMLPLAGTLVANLVLDQDHALEAARQRALRLATVGAEEQDDLVQEARTVLAVLSRVPQVAAAEPPACHGLLRQLVADHPRLASLLVTDGLGQVTCNSITPHPQINIGDRRYVRALLEPGRQGYEFSELVISQATNRPALFVGLALPTQPGGTAPTGIVSAGLNLQWLSDMAGKIAEDSGGEDGLGTATVFDVHDGTTLARSALGTVGGAAAPGGPVPGHPALQAYHRHGPGSAGTVDGTEADGVARIYGYAPLPGTDGRAVFVVSFVRSQVLASAMSWTVKAVAVTLAAVLAAVACTLLAAWRMLVRPGQAIIHMAGRISAGDLAARVALSPHQPPELRLLAAALNTMAAKMASAQTRLAESETRFRQLASTDGLTSLPNRRMFDEAYGREWRQASQDGKPLSVLLLDVDHFKLFNDRYGHLAGDGCLRAVAAAIRGAIHRQGDLVARFGGEEFAILLPATGSAAATRIAERVRAAVAACGLEHAGNAACGGVVTVSVGVATTWPLHDSAMAGECLSATAAATAKALTEADAALYAAKCAGRNQVGTTTQASAHLTALSVHQLHSSIEVAGRRQMPARHRISYNHKYHYHASAGKQDATPHPKKWERQALA